MNDLATNFRGGLEQAWGNIILFAPKVLLFAGILLVGYVLARLLGKAFDAVLERIGFDRLIERGGIKRALARTKWDASDILARLLFYFIMLFTLQLAFGVFGPNPVSTLLTSIVAYLPNIFVAAIIVVVAAAIAAGVKQIIQAALGGLSYGRFLAVAAAVAIWTVGVFAALDQLNIAPAIVNGLFYGLLAVVVGSAIVAIGGGGILPMREVWERAVNRVRNEGPRIASEVQNAGPRVKETVEHWKTEAVEAHAEAEREHGDHRPRWNQ
jgi:hypothetical protein